MRREDKEAMKILLALNLLEELQELKNMEPQQLIDMMTEWRNLVEEKAFSERVAQITMYMIQYAYRHAVGISGHKKSASTTTNEAQ